MRYAASAKQISAHAMPCRDLRMNTTRALNGDITWLGFYRKGDDFERRHEMIDDTASRFPASRQRHIIYGR